MKIATNKNREQIGMDVLKRLRELEEHERNKLYGTTQESPARDALLRAPLLLEQRT